MGPAPGAAPRSRLLVEVGRPGVILRLGEFTRTEPIVLPRRSGRHVGPLVCHCDLTDASFHAHAPTEPAAALGRNACRADISRPSRPRLPHPLPVEPPAALAPFVDLAVPRKRGRGQARRHLVRDGGRAGRRPSPPPPGQLGSRSTSTVAVGSRRCAARAYAALALDLAGFGESGPPAGFHDQDVEAGLRVPARRRCSGLPLHRLWGSAAAATGHTPCCREPRVSSARCSRTWRFISSLGCGASSRTAASAIACSAASFRAATASSTFAATRAAPAGPRAAAYCVSGERDSGVLPEETRLLAELASARCLVVPGAGHLTSIKVAPEGDDRPGTPDVRRDAEKVGSGNEVGRSRVTAIAESAYAPGVWYRSRGQAAPFDHETALPRFEAPARHRVRRGRHRRRHRRPDGGESARPWRNARAARRAALHGRRLLQHAFKRAGFTFDAATHFYPILGNPRSLTGRLLQELGVTTQWVQMDPVDVFHFPDGSKFEVPTDSDTYRARLKAEFPAEAEALDGYFAEVEHLYLMGARLHFFRDRESYRTCGAAATCRCRDPNGPPFPGPEAQAPADRR